MTMSPAQWRYSSDRSLPNVTHVGQSQLKQSTRLRSEMSASTPLTRQDLREGRKTKGVKGVLHCGYDPPAFHSSGVSTVQGRFSTLAELHEKFCYGSIDAGFRILQSYIAKALMVRRPGEIFLKLVRLQVAPHYFGHILRAARGREESRRIDVRQVYRGHR